MRLNQHLTRLARKAMQEAFGLESPEPDLRVATDPRFGDYQINGVLPLAKQLKGNPRQLAEKLVAALDFDGACLPPEIAGPGFINLRLDPAWVGQQVGRIAVDERLGVEEQNPTQSIVVDFSSPNVAKRMHVGHLRSTILGDSLVRTLRFLGHRVVGDNHVGDWGTQFGTLIWSFKQGHDAILLEQDPLGELERLYKHGSERARESAEVAEEARQELSRLQAGDPENKALWERFVGLSRRDAESLYDRLNVSFDSWKGESHYNQVLPALVERMVAQGLAREDQGAIAIFYGDHPELGDKPFLVRKKDGAFLYATTDLATLEERLEHYDPDRIIYVVDVRQSLHFVQLFEAARLLGMAQNGHPRLEHVGFGMMLGQDGRPFKTREGGTVTLAALLDEASERVYPKVAERYPEANHDELHRLAEQVGIGAVKYADLCQHRTTDYRFDWEKLLAFEGNTGPYLQYSLVRTRSLLREHLVRFGSEFEPVAGELKLEEPEEKALAVELLRLGDVLDRVAEHLTPHLLCEYLFGLGRCYNVFWDRCPILKVEIPDSVRRRRLTLSAGVARAFEIGLSLLNIPALERM
ncbi:arginine--tRNA ligase [bacterium CPR1]|nr:arginine--tRNA ligase [bacterium CPR1]